MEIQNHPNRFVVVRAWGDEPVRQVLYHIDSKRHIAFVGGDACRRPIGIPLNQAFWYEESVFLRLTAAYENGEMAELLSIYAHIEKDDKYCIKYQDKIDSLHGQEHVAHIERSSGRSEQ